MAALNSDEIDDLLVSRAASSPLNLFARSGRDLCLHITEASLRLDRGASGEC